MQEARRDPPGVPAAGVATPTASCPCARKPPLEAGAGPVALWVTAAGSLPSAYAFVPFVQLCGNPARQRLVIYTMYAATPDKLGLVPVLV